MLVEQALQQILSDDAGVSALVNGRIYAGTLPQSVDYPAIAYRLVSSSREPLLASRSTSPPNSRYVFFSASKGVVAGVGAKKMSLLVDKAVRLALQGYKDVVILTASSPEEMVDIQGIFFQDASDTYDDPTQTHQSASTFDVHYSEEVP